MDMKNYNIRGFRGIEFYDNSGASCSIQESSCIDPHIWLGINEVIPKIFLPDIAKRNDQKGWVDLPVPDYIKLFGRMHLSQEQVKELLPLLQYFAENGTLPPNINSYNIDKDKVDDSADTVKVTMPVSFVDKPNKNCSIFPGSIAKYNINENINNVSIEEEKKKVNE